MTWLGSKFHKKYKKKNQTKKQQPQTILKLDSSMTLQYQIVSMYRYTRSSQFKKEINTKSTIKKPLT